MRATSTKAGGTTNVSDHFAPRIVVGNELNGDPAVGQLPPFQYIGDPGNGSGITAALAAASAGYDVYIRPGTYTLPVGTHFTIPASVHVHGTPGGANGLGGTIIVASAGDASNTQDVFTSIGVGASLENIQIRVPPGANGGAAGVAIVRVNNIETVIRNVYVDMTYTGNGQRNTDFVFWSGNVFAPGTGVLFEDCEVLLPSQASSILAYTGFAMGFSGTDSVVATGRGPVYRNCVSRGGQIGFVAFNVAAPTYEGCTVDGLILSAGIGSNGIIYLLDASAITPVEGPRIIGPRVFISATGDAANASAAGIAIENGSTSGTSIELRDYLITGEQIVFATGAGLVGARQAIKIRVENNGTGQVNNGTIGPGVISGTQVGVLVQTRTADNTSGVKGSINDLSLTGVVCRGFATFGAFTGEGLEIDIVTVPAQPKINRVTASGCDFSGAPAGTNGVIISAAGVVNTCLCGNQLTPNGGTAWTDLGTGSQITGNVP